MPYADPERQRQAVRESAARRRAREGAADLKAAGGTETLPDPPTREELLRILGEQSRGGNTAAIRLLLEEQRRDNSDEKPKQSFTDELAARRAG